MDELKFVVHMFIILYALPLILYFDLFVETMNIKYLWYKRTFAARSLSTKTRFKKFSKKEEVGSYFLDGNNSISKHGYVYSYANLYLYRRV